MDRVSELSAKYGELTGEPLVRQLVVQNEFGGRFVFATSFGVEAVGLLSIVAKVDPTLPVIFNNTGKLPPETLDYRDKVIDVLKLKNVRTIGPSSDAIRARDRYGRLWKKDGGSKCCTLRKVEPFQGALSQFDAFVTGRRAEHGGIRAYMHTFERASLGHIRINPLAYMTWEQLQAVINKQPQLRHPLEGKFSSIGCLPCTFENSDPCNRRAGRRELSHEPSEEGECRINL